MCVTPAIPTKTVVDPHAVYDDALLIIGLGLSSTAVDRARRTGALRHMRAGHRILYRGQWIIDWLEAGADRQERNSS